MVNLVCLGAWGLFAQEPAPLLKIVREDMKPGKSTAHEKTESAYARTFRKTNFPNYFAWEGMTGQTQVWFVEGYSNYAGIEAASKITNGEPLKTTLDQLDVEDAELRTGERTMIARYAKELSYFPVPLNSARIHFIWLTVIRVQPFHGEEFAEIRKIQGSAFQKSGVQAISIVYSVLQGAPAATFLVITPLESLSAMDERARSNSREVLGDKFDRLKKLRSEIIVSSDDTLFAINPKMSNPPKSFIDADPNFWSPKQVVK